MQDFAFELPEESIALFPRPRGSSRLLVLYRNDDRIVESNVRELPFFLAPGDVLLVNDVKVMPARLRGQRAGGGSVELLLLRQLGDGGWEALIRPAAKVKEGSVLRFPWGWCDVHRCRTGGRVEVAFSPPLNLELLAQVGEIPLPPYIAKKRPTQPEDSSRYQTVYASSGQAVAAPTAGLHLTSELLAACAARGVEVLSLTLHVGPGTFTPVKAEDPRQHQLEPEAYAIPSRTADALNAALRHNRRIICVGTTAVRAFEAALQEGRGRVCAGDSWAKTYILPGFTFRGTGGLLTNFHLPRSTLLLLVAAFAGRDQVLAAYEQAQSRGFTFYSYGDAMLIL